MNDFAKYFNNAHLSDMTIICGDESYAAHRLVLARGSDVFDRMLSDGWDGAKKVVELVEESSCTRVFAAFLRFLYCNHVVLHVENTLPILVLADKYNVPSLKKVCQEYAVKEILPNLTLKEIFSEWFSYATRAYHPPLIRACISAIGKEFETVISDEWESEWEGIDSEQMAEILKCNALVVSNEFRVWQALLRWLHSPAHPERTLANNASSFLSQLLPLIRFPFMSGEELAEAEYSTVPESGKHLLMQHVNLAYKYQAQPLARRVGPIEFCGSQFLLRQYTDVRWHTRFVLPRSELENRSAMEKSLSFVTRSSTIPISAWQWALKVHNSGYASDEVTKVFLVAEDIDQSRSVEYLFAICDDNKILRSMAGKKTFTKTRYSTELSLKHKNADTPFHEVIRDSSLFIDDHLHVQLMLKPID